MSMSLASQRSTRVYRKCVKLRLVKAQWDLAMCLDESSIDSVIWLLTVLHRQWVETTVRCGTC